MSETIFFQYAILSSEIFVQWSDRNKRHPLRSPLLHLVFCCSLDNIVLDSNFWKVCDCHTQFCNTIQTTTTCSIAEGRKDSRKHGMRKGIGPHYMLCWGTAPLCFILFHTQALSLLSFSPSFFSYAQATITDCVLAIGLKFH